MSQVPLAQPPSSGNGPFDRWVFLLWKRISSAGQLLWSYLDFTGSNLTDLETRNHADLQNLNTTNYYHLTQANHTDLTDGGDSTLHYHASDRARANHTGTQLAATISDFDNAVGATTILTGLVSGGVVSINVDPTKIDISAAVYYIQGNKYTYAGATGLSNGFGTGETVRRFGLSSAGLVSQQTAFSNAQEQTIIPIARVNAVQGESGPTANLLQPIDLRFIISEFGYLQRQWQEEAIGVLYYTGGIISENVTPFRVDQSSGVFYDAQRKRVTITGSSIIEAIPVYHTAGVWTVGTKSTLIVSNSQYDNGTDLTAIPNNKWVNHTLLRAPKAEDQFFIVYSRSVYSSQAEAQAASADYGIFVNQASSALVAVAQFVVKEGATDIATVVDRRPFIGGNVGATLGTSTLQQTYDNSTTPEIVTDNVRGALTLKQGSGSDTDTMFEVQNGSGSVTFSVNGHGIVTFRSTNPDLMAFAAAQG